MRDEFRNGELTRRTFLRGVLAGSALLLSSCQSARTPAPTSGSSTGRARSGPTPAPAANPKLPRPDLPWTDHNVPPTYFKFPPAYQATSGVPGAGGPLTEVTWFSNQFSTPVAPLDSNACWQELNKRLGVTITPVWSPADAASFEQKFATLVAGGDLPHVVLLSGLTGTPAQAQALQQGAFRWVSMIRPSVCIRPPR